MFVGLALEKFVSLNSVVVKFFSGKSSKVLSNAICKSFGCELGSISRREFSDGELCVGFEESVRGCDLYLIQSTRPPAGNLFELLLLIDAAHRASARQITAVIPYYGYARQDRKDRPRVAITAKLIANMLSTAGVGRILTMDLHAGQIQGFFDVPVNHLDGTAIFVPFLESLSLRNLMFAAPDVGSSARTRVFAKKFNAPMVICVKDRKEANKIESIQIIGDVKDYDVVIVDDLCDTAGTICKASDMIMEKGARSVRAVCTHAVLSGGALGLIEKSSLQELIITDTVPLREEMLKVPKIKILSVADLFAEAIRRIDSHETISELFITSRDQ